MPDELTLLEQAKRILVLLFLVMLLSTDPMPASRTAFCVTQPIIVYVMPPSARRSRRRRTFTTTFLQYQ